LDPIQPWAEFATTKADHRIWDGALAAQWLGALKKRLEYPRSILI
jgi:pyruvate/2-oxoglutarate dehydrogenase complex dihydrolipoamide acyltransferase (E2) component